MTGATIYKATYEEHKMLSGFMGFSPVVIDFNYIMMVVMKINRTERFKITIWAGCVDVTDYELPDAECEIIRVNATDESSWIELIVTACIEFIEYVTANKITV